MNEQNSLSTPPDFEDGMLDVGDGHRMYWRVQGDPALPVVCIVHGGPGGSHNPRTVSLFDTSRWRIVLFDQRGCGRSTPTADIEHNTTGHLVEDMEKLRRALGIDRWALFGGSWGTRLAMSYGIAHPERCLGFLMRGVFLGRREDIAWFLWEVRRLFPDAHERFIDVVAKLAGRAPADVDDLLDLTAPLLEPDHAGRFELSLAWDQFEVAMSSVGAMPISSPPTSMPAVAPREHRSITLAVLEHHYMRNVLPGEAEILSLIGVLSHLPCEIVHGRYDAVCPIDQAWLLSRAWPDANLSIAAVSGHWGFAPEVADLLKQGASRLLTRIQADT